MKRILRQTSWSLLTIGLILQSHATEVRIATYNIRLGLEAPGSESYEGLRTIINRIAPEILVFQETLSGDRANAPSFLDTFTSDLAYPHVFVPTRGIGFSSRVAVLSRYPFSSTESITSPENANDVTRAAAAVVVDVPGTENDPIIIGAHLKCCLDPEDPFRRSVEMRRIRNHLTEKNYTRNDNIVITGDFNLVGNATSFNTPPASLPTSFRLGDDIQNELMNGIALRYSPNPLFYLSDLGITNPRPRQQNGSSTWTHSSRSILDYMLISEALRDQGAQLEIYNSSFDAAFPGLMKDGNPLPSNSSQNASDHLVIFGDFELDGGPPITLEISSLTLREGGSPATVTVEIPFPAATPRTISLNSSDASEALLENQTLLIPTGATRVTTLLTPQADSVLDGSQTATILASGSGLSGTSASVEIIDNDASVYLLTAQESPVIENFEGFEGLTNPAAWTVNDSNWRGLDDGSSAIRGPRSYGNGSLGILSGDALTLEASFKNETSETLRALEISYDAQQWRSFQNGAPDSLTASLVIGGNEVPLPELTFESDNTLPTGSLNPPTSTRKSALISELNIPAGAPFNLRFSTVPGAVNSAGSREIFINEFHYDNTSFDQGEFVEIVLGAAFSEELTAVELILYNGNSGDSYGIPRSLDTFMPGTTDSQGNQYRYLEINGLQNGNPGGDGFALVVDGAVTQFVSYEGSFTALNGAAAGMTSVDIGVAQPPQTPVGQGSLILTGRGNRAEDFTWEIAAGIHTPGQANEGQIFTSETQPQGIAIDHLSVRPFFATPVLPTLTITQVTDTTVTLSIPTQKGQRYELESSSNLTQWKDEESQVGDGRVWNVTLPRQEVQFHRVQVTLP